VSDLAVVIGAARTPFGAFGGALADMPIPELAAAAARAAMSRAGLQPDDVDELVMGVNLPGADRSIARQTALKAGIPDSRIAFTVDRACCSSLTATTLASRAVRSGDVRVALAGGGENLSLVPYFLTGLRFGVGLGEVSLSDQLVVSCPYTGVPRAVQAADEALAHGIDRRQQDDWALRSQLRFAAAARDGLLDEEIIAVQASGTGGRGRGSKGSPLLVTHDESPRPETTAGQLAALPTVYGSATVTAGNAPGLSTGAAFLAICSAPVARRQGWPVLASIIATAQVAGPPAQIASIPAAAALAVLRRAGRTLDEVDLLEVNEAFAAVPLVTTLLLAGGDQARAAALRQRTNVNGGAVAAGHPTGASGARLVMTISNELRRRGGGIGLVTMCGGVGEGEAVLVEVKHREAA
jgi:acetyl-CoA C-acetyltransferase